MATGLEPVQITSQKHDPAWKHCQMFKNGDRVQLKCIYCGKLFKGGGIHRIKEHLAGQKGNASTCLRVTSDVRAMMQQSLDGVMVKKRKKQKIAEEITGINPVSGEIDAYVDQVGDVSTGLPMVEVSNAVEGNSGLFVNREGTSNVSGDRRKKWRGKNSSANANAVVVSCVSSGAKRVNDSIFMAVGRFLYDIGAPLDAVNSVYFQPMVNAIASGGSEVVMPCYHDIRSWILKNSVEEVKNDIGKYRATWGRTGCSVLVDQWSTEMGRTLLIFSAYCPEGTVAVLNMVRRYTYGNDLIEPGITRSATNFTALKRLVDIKHNLQTMVTSQEWLDCPHSKKSGGLEMLDIVSNQSFWSSCGLIVRLTIPLLRLLRITGSEKRPAMGYVYAGMYRAKETIKKELIKRDEYMVYWNIIDHWWEQQWHLPLHAAGFFLNPKFFYSIKDEPNEFLSGMLDCIERLVPDTVEQDNIVREINSYKNAAGDFGRKMAIRAKDTLLPAEWWSTYGGSCPKLSRLAIRILSQTCSSMGYKRNQIQFEQIYETRNCLERQRLSDLVFVQYNLRLRQMVEKSKEQEYMDPMSFDCLSNVEDWITGKDVLLEDYGSSDWMALDPPSANTMLLQPSNDDVEELTAGFDDDEIFNRVKEEENIDDNA
ncbi:hypothetical protein LWI29_035493 [Acer saccharum]|uniref:BED-type domain-containing protein n=1 Tax=Acer saccharum TaxID=4024 RepID=A0AA39SHR1_ACESA|nr:hypothetical protein LWI29_031118 [Acer saccharum]KAK0593368.1 hypothetical protein LWI29_035493 [Acer saccharum]